MEATISSNLHYITSYLIGLLSIFKNANLFFSYHLLKIFSLLPSVYSQILVWLKRHFSIQPKLSLVLYNLAILSYLNF